MLQTLHVLCLADVTQRWQHLPRNTSFPRILVLEKARPAATSQACEAASTCSYTVLAAFALSSIMSIRLQNTSAGHTTRLRQQLHAVHDSQI